MKVGVAMASAEDIGDPGPELPVGSMGRTLGGDQGAKLSGAFKF